MHIMEGFLQYPWCQFWTIIAAVCVIAGVAEFIRLVRRRPEALPLLGLADAFVFILSSLKIPSVESSSHPTGTGLGSVLAGDYVGVLYDCAGVSGAVSCTRRSDDAWCKYRGDGGCGIFATFVLYSISEFSVLHRFRSRL